MNKGTAQPTLCHMLISHKACSSDHGTRTYIVDLGAHAPRLTCQIIYMLAF